MSIDDLEQLKDEILKQHSKENAFKIALLAKNESWVYNGLIDFLLGDDKRLKQLTAFALSTLGDLEEALIEYRLDDFIHLIKENEHDAVIRFIVRFLANTKVPEPHQGMVLDSCFNLLTDYSTAVAIKANAITIIYKLSWQYPEILHELKDVIVELEPNATAGLKNKIKHTLADIKKREIF